VYGGFPGGSGSVLQGWRKLKNGDQRIVRRLKYTQQFPLLKAFANFFLTNLGNGTFNDYFFVPVGDQNEPSVFYEEETVPERCRPMLPQD
jgi:hypothetical protein